MEHTLNKALFIIFSEFNVLFFRKKSHFIHVRLVMQFVKLELLLPFATKTHVYRVAVNKSTRTENKRQAGRQTDTGARKFEAESAFLSIDAALPGLVRWAHCDDTLRRPL